MKIKICIETNIGNTFCEQCYYLVYGEHDFDDKCTLFKTNLEHPEGALVECYRCKACFDKFGTGDE